MKRETPKSSHVDWLKVRRILLYILIAAVVIGPSVLVVTLVQTMRRETAFTPWIERHPGGSIAVLTAPRLMSHDASVSRDGTMIAYIASEPPFLPFGVPQSAAQRGDESDGKPAYGFLMVEPSRGGRGSYLPLARGCSPVGMPRWSPDGQYLYVGVWREANGETLREIWQVAVDGGSLTQVGFGPYDAWPSLSPDGRWIAFTGTADDRAYVMHADGSRRRLMLDEPITGFTLAWSPDSTKVAFITKSPSERGLADNAGPRRFRRSRRQPSGREQRLRRALVVYDLHSDKALRLVKPYVGRQVSWSLDSSEALFASRDYGSSHWGLGGVRSRIGAIRPEPGAKPRWLTPTVDETITDPVAISPDHVAFFSPELIAVVSSQGGIPQVATREAQVQREAASVAPGSPELYYTRPMAGEYPGGAICRMRFSARFLHTVAANTLDPAALDAVGLWNGLAREPDVPAIPPTSPLAPRAKEGKRSK